MMTWIWMQIIFYHKKLKLKAKRKKQKKED